MFNFKFLYAYICNIIFLAMLNLINEFFSELKYLWFVVAVIGYIYFSLKTVKEMEKIHTDNLTSLIRYVLVLIPLRDVLTILYN